MIVADIWISTEADDLGGGSFYCPHCRAWLPYARHELAKYLELYGIRLMKLETVAEVIECSLCGISFLPAVFENFPSPQGGASLDAEPHDYSEYVYSLGSKVAPRGPRPVSASDRRKYSALAVATAVGAIVLCAALGFMLFTAASR